MKFTADRVPELEGKIVVVTGGNSGIGFEAARVFAARHARVVLACRDAIKMGAAAERLRTETLGAQVDTVTLDLASLASVRAAAAIITGKFADIDLLVNNAGVMAIPYRETPDGFEMQFGTNHLGHFALTGLLLARVLAAPAGRVVTVSSLLHQRGEIVFEDIPKPRRYDQDKAYGMSKLANLLFAYELDRRLKAGKTRALSVACHPGYSDTNLQAVGPKMSGSKLRTAVARIGNAMVAQPAEMGALSTLMAATSPEVKGSEYVGPVGLFTLRGHPVLGESNERSRDVALARRLWDVSERLTSVRYELGPA